MTVAAAVLAAGSGTRFGSDKTAVLLRGKPIWRWSVDLFCGHPEVDRVILVTAADRVEKLRAEVPEGVLVVSGGATRQESSRAALEACGDASFVLLHDGARPFLTESLVSAVIRAVQERGAAAVACPVTDTIRHLTPNGPRTLPRSELVAMQTPQAARTDLLRQAHANAPADCTDDMAMMESIGVEPLIVPGESNNFKITAPEDLLRAYSLLGIGETRTGFGYDIHPFSPDPQRPLWLGGVHFPEHVGLEGHSDADVLLHAVTDALFGAAAMGDIGVHFPNTDPRWKGKESIHFLRHAVTLVEAEGWQVVNLDATCVAEAPKIMKRALEIRGAIAEAVGVPVDRISVKATTNEKLGSIGRTEGIAAFATATLIRR